MNNGNAKSEAVPQISETPLRRPEVPPLISEAGPLDGKS